MRQYNVIANVFAAYTFFLQNYIIQICVGNCGLHACTCTSYIRMTAAQRLTVGNYNPAISYVKVIFHLRRTNETYEAMQT
jgi:hypothetical protein